MFTSTLISYTTQSGKHDNREMCMPKDVRKQIIYNNNDQPFNRHYFR